MTNPALNSILDSTKKILGLDSSYTAFDTDIIIHINSVFMILGQLGIGPVDGFMIEDNTATWEDYLGTDFNLNSVKTYVYLRVRLLFDPPGMPHLMNAMQEQIRELEVRINMHREATAYTDPFQPVEVVLDGGIV